MMKATLAQGIEWGENNRGVARDTLKVVLEGRMAAVADGHLEEMAVRGKAARPSRDAKAPGISLYELRLDRDRAVNMGRPELLDSIMRQPYRNGDAPTAEKTESPATDPDLPLLRKGWTAA